MPCHISSHFPVMLYTCFDCFGCESVHNPAWSQGLSGLEILRSPRLVVPLYRTPGEIVTWRWIQAKPGCWAFMKYCLSLPLDQKTIMWYTSSPSTTIWTRLPWNSISHRWSTYGIHLTVRKWLSPAFITFLWRLLYSESGAGHATTIRYSTIRSSVVFQINTATHLHAFTY